MAADKKKIAADCWRKGTEAMSRENWDYAVDMFARAVALMPDNVAYRQTLRGAECRKYDNNKSGARMAGMRLMGIRGKIKRARMRPDWKEVDRLAEEGLKVNPWDPQLNAEQGEACEKLGYQEPAVFGFQRALEGDPDNKKYLRQLALLLEERGQFTEAIHLWQRVQKLVSDDEEARKKITELQTNSMMERGGYADARSTQEVRTAYDYDRPARSTVPEAVEGPGESPEADLQRAIRKNPDDVNNYLKLAEIYRREKRLDDAAEILQKALEASGGDEDVREQLEDVQLAQLRQEADNAREAAKKSEDESARDQAVQAAGELLRREIEVFAKRVKRYPKDSRLKFDLAQRYMRVKKWQQAIPLLQQASADTRLENDVLAALGECFLRDKKTPLARKQFEKVVEKIDAHDRPGLFKKAHYLLGRIAEEAGDPDRADTHYNEVLAVDYEYRDTLQRLERLQSAGG